MLNKENIIAYDFKVNKKLRAIKLNQIPKLIWFTGLSGSGKSTLSDALENKLFNSGFHTYSLDGDNVRTGISNNLSFSEIDRKENIRRISEVSKLMLDAGLIVLASFVSPLNEIRNQIKEIIGEKDYLEIYVNTPIEECERRDVKGLYKKARDGKIPNFTGISSPFEKPNNPFLSIDTTNKELEYCVNIVYNEILKEIKK